MSLKVVAAPLLGFANLARRWHQQRRRVRVLVHRAFFRPVPPEFQVPYDRECYFMKVTNLSQREIWISHAWFDTDRPVHILDPALVSSGLSPDETRETWVPVADVPDVPNVERLGRVQLSSGKIVKSRLNKTVQPVGYMAG